jgi:hypothetical protein
MTELSEQGNSRRALWELNDPEFFAHWATVRNRLILTPSDSPERSEIKRRYSAVLAEYRRRIDGGMALTA